MRTYRAGLVGGRNRDTAVGALARRVTGAWARGWVAFVAAMGEPYLSLAGRLPARLDQAPETVAEAPGEPARERRCA
jgi:hypothetical protein